MSVRTKDRLSNIRSPYGSDFFIWLAGQPRYKSWISYSDAEYFDLSAEEIRSRRPTAQVPSVEQIRHVIRTIPARRRSVTGLLIAFTGLASERDRPIASLKVKHIDIDQAGAPSRGDHLRARARSRIARACR
jgi:hypothetical protein